VAGVGCFGLLGKRRPVPFALFAPSVLGLLLAYMVAYRRFGLQAGLGIIVTFALGGAIPFFARMRSPALRWTSKHVAKYSYGVYLFHTPCIWIAFGKLHRLGVIGSCLSLLVLVAITSIAAYHLIEDPLIRVGRRLASQLSGASEASRQAVPAP
jgi:peptidoglycan/LPS O-acetylase OafA/YrhL